MKKIQTEVGYVAYRTTTEEIRIVGGRDICDDCNRLQIHGGYLVPVLNYWMCEDCFNTWLSRARYYPEDISYEQETAKYYETQIPLTD